MADLTVDGSATPVVVADAEFVPPPPAGAAAPAAPDPAAAAGAAAGTLSSGIATPLAEGVTEDNEAAAKARGELEVGVLKSKDYKVDADGWLDMSRMAAHGGVHGLDVDGDGKFDRAYTVRDLGVSAGIRYNIIESPLAALTPEKKEPKGPELPANNAANAQTYFDKNFDLAEGGTTYGSRVPGIPASAGPPPVAAQPPSYTMGAGLGTVPQKQEALRRAAYQAATTDMGMDERGAQLFARDFTARFPTNPASGLTHLNKHVANPPAGLAEHYATPRAYAEFRALGDNPSEADRAHFDRVYKDRYASQPEPDQWKTVYVNGVTGQGQYRTALVGETPKAEDLPPTFAEADAAADVFIGDRKKAAVAAANGTLKKWDDDIASGEGRLKVLDGQISAEGDIDKVRKLGKDREGVAAKVAEARVGRARHHNEMLNALQSGDAVYLGNLTGKHGFTPTDTEKEKGRLAQANAQAAAEVVDDKAEGNVFSDYVAPIMKGTKDVVEFPGAIGEAVYSFGGLFGMQKPGEVRAKQEALAKELLAKLDKANTDLKDHSKTRAEGAKGFFDARIAAAEQARTAAADKGARAAMAAGLTAGTQPGGPQGQGPNYLASAKSQQNPVGPSGTSPSPGTLHAKDRAERQKALEELNKVG